MEPSSLLLSEPSRRTRRRRNRRSVDESMEQGVAERADLGWSRRGFLKSLSRTALVLSLEDVLRLARPLLGRAKSRRAARGRRMRRRRGRRPRARRRR